MKLEFVDRIAIINSILDRVNEGHELTNEMKELLKEMSK